MPHINCFFTGATTQLDHIFQYICLYIACIFFLQSTLEIGDTFLRCYQLLQSKNFFPHISVFSQFTLELRYMWSVQKVSSHVLGKIEAFIEEDRRYKKHCTQDNDISVSFKVMTFLRKSGSLIWFESSH